jgi:RND family efflux transporter MFP subunit
MKLPGLYLVSGGIVFGASLLVASNLAPSLNPFAGRAASAQEPAKLATLSPAAKRRLDAAKSPLGDLPSAIDRAPTGSIPSGRSVGMIDAVAGGNAVRVVVRPFQHVTIGSELNARILKLDVREGESFRAGDVLVSFDCARTEAELASARAVHSGHKAAYSNAAAMLKYKAAGAFSVQQAKFEMEKSGADVRNLEAKRGSCQIVAPFNGRVVEKVAQAYEVVSPNQPLLKIVDDRPPELDLMAPSRWLSWLKPGTPFSMQVDETGETYEAVVEQIGGAVDPVSQSVRLRAKIPAKTAVLAGMSGTATFHTPGRPLEIKTSEIKTSEIKTSEIKSMEVKP